MVRGGREYGVETDMGQKGAVESTLLMSEGTGTYF